MSPAFAPLTFFVPFLTQSGWWERRRLEGQRPFPVLLSTNGVVFLWLNVLVVLLWRPKFSSVPILLPSMFKAPVPHLKQFAATVFSLRGFRARQIGSVAGLRAVPQPCQR
jgi:hypothetical protein